VAKPVFATNDVPTADQFNQWLVNVNYARATVTQSVTSSTTLTAHSQITVPVQANAEYDLWLWLSYDGATAADMKIQIDMPAGASYSGHLQALVSTAAGQQDFQAFTWTGGSTIVGALGSAATCWTRGLMIVGGTSGNASLSFAQNAVSGTSTRIFAPSFLRLERVS
jgi:hypothetical protein